MTTRRGWVRGAAALLLLGVMIVESQPSPAQKEHPAQRTEKHVSEGLQHVAGEPQRFVGGPHNVVGEHNPEAGRPGNEIEGVAADTSSTWATRLVRAATERTRVRVRYDGAYVSIDYPGGDVPEHTGVCTDLVIRSYRKLGFDLQKAVHEDMKRSFEAYPKNWGLRRPDPNIDHRRVPNLRTFFERQGAQLPLPTEGDWTAFRPGDLVTFLVAGRLPHIGIVSGSRSRDGMRPLILHNIGRGPEMEDCIDAHAVTGHYRFPVNVNAAQ